MNSSSSHLSRRCLRRTPCLWLGYLKYAKNGRKTKRSSNANALCSGGIVNESCRNASRAYKSARY